MNVENVANKVTKAEIVRNYLTANPGMNYRGASQKFAAEHNANLDDSTFYNIKSQLKKRLETKTVEQPVNQPTQIKKVAKKAAKKTTKKATKKAVRNQNFHAAKFTTASFLETAAQIRKIQVNGKGAYSPSELFLILGQSEKAEEVQKVEYVLEKLKEMEVL